MFYCIKQVRSLICICCPRGISYLNIFHQVTKQDNPRQINIGRIAFCHSTNQIISWLLQFSIQGFKKQLDLIHTNKTPKFNKQPIIHIIIAAVSFDVGREILSCFSCFSAHVKPQCMYHQPAPLSSAQFEQVVGGRLGRNTGCGFAVLMATELSLPLNCFTSSSTRVVKLSRQ